MTKFIDTKLESESNSELESDTELQSKLESASDYEQFFTHTTSSQMVAYYFEQVTNIGVILLTLGKPKN